MLNGLMPHRDFPLWHMPLLPIYIGMTLHIFQDMYWVRVLYLFLNCFSVLPMYLILRTIGQNVRAGLFASSFYLTDYLLVHQDFRFVAIRQMAGVLLIGFLYFGLQRSYTRFAWLMQAVFASLSTLLFLPTVISLTLVSGAVVLSTSLEGQWQRQLMRYLRIGGVALFVILLYFLLIPHSVEQVIMSQVHRPGLSRLARVGIIIHELNALYYCFSLISLCITALCCRRLRWYALAMIGLIGSSVFLSNNFYRHYLTFGAFAFAFGIFGFVLCFEKWLGKRWNGHAIVGIVTSCMLALHLSVVGPALLHEWNDNRNPHYYASVHVLGNAPDPLFTLEPIYAVESRRELVPDMQDLYMRAPQLSQAWGPDDYEQIAQKACTILLENKANAYIPRPIRQQWTQTYRILQRNEAGIVLLTDQPHCASK